jgi:hypothetical protein
MRRRSALQSLVAIPAASLLPTTSSAQTATPPQPPRDEQYKLDLTAAENASESVLRYFSASQFAALKGLCGAIVPSLDGRPGAVECEVPEFLDFLIGASPEAAQAAYKAGLDRLASSGVNDQALAPLREPWTYNGPAEPYSRFLVMAKDDILRATFNSRLWAESASQGGRRRGGGTNYYWLAME